MTKVGEEMGQENVGDVTSTDGYGQAGHMSEMLEKICPEIDRCVKVHPDAHCCGFENDVGRKNVEIMVNRVRTESEILNHMEHEGHIKVVGAIFNLHT